MIKPRIYGTDGTVAIRLVGSRSSTCREGLESTISIALFVLLIALESQIARRAKKKMSVWVMAEKSHGRV